MTPGDFWYYSRFPEDLYPTRPEHKLEYEARVITGINKAGKSSVVIGGLARNIAGNFPFMRARLEKLGSYFRVHRIFIYENDSEDNTVNLLHAWGIENRRVRWMSEDLDFELLNDKSETRMRQMAYARNCLLDIMSGARADYVIIIDSDIAGGFSYDSVMDSLAQMANADLIGANSLIYDDKNRLYYDSFALRFNPDISDEEKNGLAYSRGEPLVPVESVFGGIAIYRYDAYFCGAEYGASDCEHVHFHKELKKHGYDRFYLNPSLICSQTRLL